MGVYFWQDVPYRTFTISWEEKSDMSSWWTYSDDAAWLTAGDTAFDEFFWYSWVRLNSSWVETAEITQAQSWWGWKLDITQLWTLTSGDNVMIKFPVRWIKMTKSWSVVTLSITDWLGRESEWYQYYAHCTWTLSNPWTPKNAFYLGSYKWYTDSGVLKSWSWKSITGSQTQSTFCTQAKANGSWYNIIWFYQRQYINALYMMKYWNPDSQTTVGYWYTWWSAKTNTWWTNSQINATYWTTSSTTQAKLFWLEDWWGNVYEWIWGMYTDGNKQLYTFLSWRSWTISWGEWTWTTITRTDGYNLSSIAGNNKAMFSPIWTVTNSSYNTYYGDYNQVAASSLAYAWWYYSQGGYGGAGAFYLCVNRDETYTYGALGTRLMYL